MKGRGGLLSRFTLSFKLSRVVLIFCRVGFKNGVCKNRFIQIQPKKTSADNAVGLILRLLEAKNELLLNRISIGGGAATSLEDGNS